MGERTLAFRSRNLQFSLFFEKSLFPAKEIALPGKRKNRFTSVKPSFLRREDRFHKIKTVLFKNKDRSLVCNSLRIIPNLWENELRFHKKEQEAA